MIRKLKAKILADVHFSELFRGSSIAFIYRIVGMGFGYIFTLMIARWYGVDTMGLFALSLTLLNIFVTIGLFGFDNALIKFISDYNSNEKPHLIKEVYIKSLAIVVPFGIMLSFILFFGAEYFATNIFNNESLIFYFKIMSLAILPFVLLRINTTVFRGLKKIKLFSLFESVGISLLCVVLLALISMKTHVGFVTIMVQDISIVAVMIVSFIYIKKCTNIFQTTSLNVLKYKVLLKVSLPMLLASSMGLVMGWTDIIMLGIFRNEEEIGVYSVVIKVAALTSITLMAINTIAAPKFSEFYSTGDMEGLKSVAQNSTKMIFYSSFPVILILTVFSESILRMFGKEFVVGTVALWILMFGQFINSITGSVGYILNMTGKYILVNKIVFFSCLLNFALNYFFIQIYGIIGAAIGTAISLSFANLMSLFFVRYYYGFYSIDILNLLRIDK